MHGSIRIKIECIPPLASQRLFSRPIPSTDLQCLLGGPKYQAVTAEIDSSQWPPFTCVRFETHMWIFSQVMEPRACLNAANKSSSIATSAKVLPGLCKAMCRQVGMSLSICLHVPLKLPDVRKTLLHLVYYVQPEFLGLDCLWCLFWHICFQYRVGHCSYNGNTHANPHPVVFPERLPNCTVILTGTGTT